MSRHWVWRTTTEKLFKGACQEILGSYEHDGGMVSKLLLLVKAETRCLADVGHLSSSGNISPVLRHHAPIRGFGCVYEHTTFRASLLHTNGEKPSMTLAVNPQYLSQKTSLCF